MALLHYSVTVEFDVNPADPSSAQKALDDLATIGEVTNVKAKAKSDKPAKSTSSAS